MTIHTFDGQVVVGAGSGVDSRRVMANRAAGAATMEVCLTTGFGQAWLREEGEGGGEEGKREEKRGGELGLSGMAPRGGRRRRKRGRAVGLFLFRVHV